MWYALTVVMSLLFVGGIVVWLVGKDEQVKVETPRLRVWGLSVAAASAVFWILGSAFFIWHQVEAGHVGLVKAFGAYTGVKEAGLITTFPWENVEQARIRNASHELRMDGGPSGSAASRESQEVFVVATINYSLAKDCVRTLYTNYGGDYYLTVIEPRARQIFKAESVKFAAVDILPNREKIRRETQEELATQLNDSKLFGADCVTGLDFLLTNIGFGPEFTAAIEEKQVATQQAAAELNRVQIARQQANQKIATARGDAQATRIQARADAFANRLRSRNLTRQLVEWERIQKWQPEVIYLPSGAIVGLPGVGAK